jgi:hypothetical protein
MTVIKPRTRGKHVIAHRIRLDRENADTLYAYAAFIDEDVDYVVNELIETVLKKDRAFATWRTQHTQSFVPVRTGRRRGRNQRAATPLRAVSVVPGDSVTSPGGRH